MSMASDKKGQERLLNFGTEAANEGRMHAEREMLEMSDRAEDPVTVHDTIKLLKRRVCQGIQGTVAKANTRYREGVAGGQGGRGPLARRLRGIHEGFLPEPR